MNQSPAFRRSWLLVPITAMLAVGCGSSSGTDIPGSGGSPGTGGSGTGGASTGGIFGGASGGASSGGAPGTGGAAATGGAPGTGGTAPSTGGTVGTGGVSATGGAGGETATGGTASGGGKTGAGGIVGGGGKGTGGNAGAGAGANGGAVGGTGTGGVPSNCNLSTPVSFKKDVEPILAASCGKNTSSGCHVVDNSSTLGSLCPDGTKTCGSDHAYDWITAGSHASSCPETPNPKRFQVVLDVIHGANPASCSKSGIMPPPPTAALTACQIAAFQAWLAEPLTMPQLHRTDDSSPTTPYQMPPYN